MFSFNFFKPLSTTIKEKNQVSAKEFLKNPNKGIKISLEDKDSICVISNNAKRQVLQAILDFYNIKAELKPAKVRKLKVKVEKDAE